MRRKTILLFLLTFSISLAAAQQHEAAYRDSINMHLQGETEVTVTSGRVDIVTDTHAYEVEWAHKWKQSVGQALWYGLQTNRKPGIVIIMEDQQDFTYVQQLYSTLEYAGLSEAIDVSVYPLDYGGR